MSFSLRNFQLLAFQISLIVEVALSQETLTPVSEASQPTAAVAPPGSDRVHWADLGDSWSSGVAWLGGGVEFDNNENNCLRIKDAYTVQMKNDDSWTNSYVNFTACSGSLLVDMVQGDGFRSHQMDDSGVPAFITMTAGGNNLGFAGVAMDCLFDTDKSAIHYADDDSRTGKCAKSIDRARDLIDGTFKQDVMNTIGDIFNHPNVHDGINMYGKFAIFYSGYARFFNEDTDYCNSWRMINLPGLKSGLLSKKLRRDINDLITRTNKNIQGAINDFPYPTNTNKYAARFVDPNPGFDGHRFCEQNIAAPKQSTFALNGPSIWIWNLQVTLTDTSMDTINSNAAVEADPASADLSQEQKDMLKNGNMPLPWSSGDSGSNGDVANGITMRVFHPKAAGHNAMKNAFIEMIREEGFKGIN